MGVQTLLVESFGQGSHRLALWAFQTCEFLPGGAAVEGMVTKAGLSGLYAFIPFILGLPNQDIGRNIELPVQAPDHPD